MLVQREDIINYSTWDCALKRFKTSDLSSPVLGKAWHGGSLHLYMNLSRAYRIPVERTRPRFPSERVPTAFVCVRVQLQAMEVDDASGANNSATDSDEPFPSVPEYRVRTPCAPSPTGFPPLTTAAKDSTKDAKNSGTYAHTHAHILT